MGYTTDFIGHIDAEPALNQAEQAYLTAFAGSRRWRRPEGPYAVPPNPAAARRDDEGGLEVNGEAYNSTAEGQPGLWCDWVPCWDGCCLSYNGYEKFYRSTRWMAYLIEHFLAPDAHASRSGLAWFEEFSFDHRLDGVIAGCRRDDKELFLIRVDDNVVTEEILRPADARLAVRERLAYEAYLDEQKKRRNLRRRPQPRRGRR